MGTKHLLSTLALLVDDSGRWCQKGDLVTLVGQMPTPNITDLGPNDRIVLAIRSVTQNQWNMLTCMQRLEWMRVAAASDGHVASNWSNYASADIEYWHVNFRSLLDYVAFVLLLIAGQKAKDPPKSSFHSLHESCTSGDQSKLIGVTDKIGPESVRLVQSATWFRQIISVRTSIIHRRGHTLVFGGPHDGILFQVYGDLQQKLIANKDWMFNSNVAYFDRYAAHLMSHLIVFLEEFASIAARRLEMLPLPDRDARNCHDGFAVVKAWIDASLAAGT